MGVGMVERDWNDVRGSAIGMNEVSALVRMPIDYRLFLIGTLLIRNRRGLMGR